MRTWLTVTFVAVAATIYGLSAERELFNQAETRFAGGNYAFALESYEQFLATYPLSELVADAQYRRAVSLYQLGRYRDSLTVLESIQQRHRRTRYIAYVPFWAGVSLFHVADYERAAFSLEQFVTAALAAEGASGTGAGGDAVTADRVLVDQALLYRTMSLQALGDWDAVAESARTMRGRDLNPAARGYATAVLADILLRDRQYDAVLDVADPGEIGAYPQPWRGLATLYRAEALWALERYAAAAELYRGLLNAADDVASTAFRRLFIASRRGGDFDAMERLAQQAEARFAAEPAVLNDFWLRLGIDSYRRGNLDLAEHFLDRVWQLRADVSVGAAAPLYLAEVYLALDRSEDALGVLAAFLDEGRDESGDAALRLGDIVLDRQDYARAAEYYGSYLQNHAAGERRAEAGYLQAYALYRGGEADAALQVITTQLGPGEPPYVREYLRLSVLLKRRGGDLNGALADSNRIIASFPRDVRAQVDRIKILFDLERMREVIVAARRLGESFPDLARDDPRSYLLAGYLRGLAEVAERAYDEAIRSLAIVTADAAAAEGLQAIVPYTLYYRGWALYRTGQFAPAAVEVGQLTARFPEHELAVDGAYLLGWTQFSLGRFSDAYTIFTDLATSGADSELRARASYLAGQSAANDDLFERAAAAFEASYEQSLRTEVADDALYELAEARVAVGQTDAAVAALRRLLEGHSTSGLVAPARYRIAEILFDAQRYAAARDAFTDYRRSHPAGSQIDAALYWGGVAAMRAGETFGAVLLWEQLADRYPASTFRPESLRLTAEAYVDRGDFRTALAVYTELLSRHPADAQRLGADTRVEEVRLQLLGLSDREAELSAAITRTGGVTARAGREAMLELARIYIFDSSAADELAYQLLTDVAAYDDVQTAADAQFLIGEYLAARGDPAAAGDAFLAAAGLDPDNRDLTAASLFRAAEMARLLGNTARTRQLVEQLIGRFADTEWARQADRLLGGGTQ